MQRYTFLSTFVVSGLVAGATGAQTVAKDPYPKPDDSWISIPGTVVETGADAFTLDYGESIIIVEMDDWGTYGEVHSLIVGDQVTVHDRIDDGLFALATIETDTVTTLLDATRASAS